MLVPAIALYPIPPATACGPLCDPDPNPKSFGGGGLSRLFSSSPSSRHSPAFSLSFTGGDDTAADLTLSSSLSYSCSPSSRSLPASPIRVSAGKDRIFRSFIRNALGSCFDHDSPRLPNGGGIDVDEFGFDLGESFVEPYARELLTGAQSRYKVFNEEFVVRAFYEAEKAHRGQMRKSGVPYLQHCVETAVLLAKIGANSVVVAAGLLHDTLDDSFMDYDCVHRRFGAGLADLVEGVSKLSQLSKLAREKNTASRTIEADRLHTMFLAMADARAVLIKLADRLHNMMTLEALPMVKQQRFAKETLEVFAPLANRLGIYSWKEKLENLCFKYLYPEQYKLLSSKLIRCFDEAMIASAIEKLEQVLKVNGVSYHVIYGRHKSLYSIHSKMVKKNLTMDEIHDIHGLRLIVEKEEDCYIALDIVHQLWPKVLGRVRDYITHPKFNGYQSLHTVVSEDTLPLEVQIRTKAMHLQAEFGFAAHWRYKEGDRQHSSFVLQMVEWARWVVTWQCKTVNADRPMSYGNADSGRLSCPFPSHSHDCPYSSSPWCDHNGPIFIILLENEKMSVQEFAPNSTVMDLLERTGKGSPRWSRYNFPLKEELRPRLNQEPVNDPNQKLRMGDVVELSPSIPDESLTGYREEIQRMYDRGLSLSS